VGGAGAGTRGCCGTNTISNVSSVADDDVGSGYGEVVCI